MTLVGEYGKGWGGDKKQLLQQFELTVFAAAKKHAARIAGVRLRLYTHTLSDNTRRLGKIETKGLNFWERETLVKRCETKYLNTGQDLAEVMKHPAIDLLHKPNPVQHGRELFTYIELERAISGSVYIHHIDYQGVPAILWLLPSYLVKVNQGDDGFPDEYRFGNASFKPKEMLVDTTENLYAPYSGLPGQSPVKAVMKVLGLQYDVIGKLSSLLRSPRASMILRPKSEFNSLSDETRELWHRQAAQFKSSMENDIMILDEDAEATILNAIPADLSAIEIMKLVEREVAKAFGMNLTILVGGGEQANRAHYQAAVSEWLQGGIHSRLMELEEWLNYKYLPLFPDSEDLFFAFDDPEPKSEIDQMNLYVTGAGGPVITVDESRSALGFPPLPDSQGTRLRELVTEQPGDEGSGPTPEGDGSDREDEPLLPLDDARSIVASVVKGELPRDSGIELLRTYGMPLERATKIMGSAGMRKTPARRTNVPPNGSQLIPILRKHFQEWRKAALAAVHKSATGIERKDIDGGIVVKGLPDAFVPVGDWDASLAADAFPVISMIFKDGGNKLLGRVGASPKVYDVFNPKAAEYARQATLDFAKSTMDSTTKDLNQALAETREAIASGLEVGSTVNELSDRVGEIFDGLEDSRCKMIAQTESARAYNFGLRDSAKESGVVKELRWLTTSDPCPVCLELEGTLIPLDSDDLPPQHCNCFCCLEEIIDESVLDDAG